MVSHYYKLLLESSDLDALQRYVQDERSSLPNELVLRLMKDHFYNKDEPKNIYRGINFRTKNEYDAFMNDYKDGKISFNRPTSWDVTQEGAESFARSKMVNDFGQFDRSDMDQIKQLNKEGIMGFKGVILKTEISIGQALDVCDAVNCVENEYILPKGSYKVEIAQEVGKYSDGISEEWFKENVSNFKDVNDKKLQYILNNKPEWVSKREFDILWNLNNKEVKPYYNYEEKPLGRLLGSGESQKHIGFHLGIYPLNTMTYYSEFEHMIRDENLETMREVYKEPLNKFIKDFKKFRNSFNPDILFDENFNESYSLIEFKFVDLKYAPEEEADTVDEMITEYYKDAYRKVSGRDFNNKVSKGNMRNVTKFMEKLLGDMAKFGKISER